MIRENNRRLKWNLSTNRQKTLSGLILENVQSIPETNVDISINEYRFETILIKDNVVKIAKVQKLELDLLGDETKEE